MLIYVLRMSNILESIKFIIICYLDFKRIYKVVPYGLNMSMVILNLDWTLRWYS